MKARYITVLGSTVLAVLAVGCGGSTNSSSRRADHSPSGVAVTSVMKAGAVGMLRKA
jgi:hypothetical protein